MIFKIALSNLFLILSLTIINGSPHKTDLDGADITVKQAYKDPEPSRDGPESLRVLENYLETIREYLSTDFYAIRRDSTRFEEMHTVGRNLFISAFDVGFNYLNQLSLVLQATLRDQCHGVQPDTLCADHSADIEMGLIGIDAIDSIRKKVADQVRTKLKQFKDELNDIKISVQLLLEQIVYHIQKENNLISGVRVEKSVQSFSQALTAFGNNMISEKGHTPSYNEQSSSFQKELDDIIQSCDQRNMLNMIEEIERISGNFNSALKVMDRLNIAMESVSEVVIEQLSGILVAEEPNLVTSYKDMRKQIFEHLKVNDEDLTVAESQSDLNDLKRYYVHLNLWKSQIDFLSYVLQDCHRKAFYVFHEV